MKRFVLILIFFLVPILVYSQKLSEEDERKAYQAVEYMDSGNLDKAVELLKDILKSNPGHYAVSYELGLAYYRQEDYDSAIKVFENLRKSKYADALLYQAWGNAYDMRGERDKALKTYDRGLKLFPDSGPLYLEKGNLEYLSGNYNEALLLYENGIKVAPDFTSNYYRAANILYHSDEPIFAILYATVYRFLDPGSERSSEMGAMISDIYREHITFETSGDSTSSSKAHVSLTKKNNITLSQKDLEDPKALLAKLSSFELTYERGILASAALTRAAARKELTFEDLIQIRKDALDFYFKDREDRGDALRMSERVAVMEYEKKILEAGYWEVYNAWLMGTNAFSGADEVFEREESKFDGFVDWVVNHRFLPSKDGLTLRGD